MGGPVISTARALHAWAGAILSALMIVLSLSGALLVWKEDYLRLTMPEARQPFEATPDNLAILANTAETKFGRENIRLIVFGTEHFGINKVYLHGEDFAYLDGEGNVLATWHGTARFEEWLFDLHHYLLAGRTGKLVAGAAGLSMAVLIIAGLIAFWPTRKAFRLGMAVRSLRRPHLLLSHRNIGIIFAVPAFLLILTGGAIVYYGPTKAILTVFDTPAPAPQPVARVEAQDWQAVFTAGQAAFPDADIRMGSWPSESRPAASVRMRRAPEWHPNGRTYLAAPLAQGEPTTTTNAQAAPLGERAYNAFYPLHAAKTGGIVYKLVVFMTGIALTALGLLGLISFVQRLLGMRPAPAIRRSTQSVTPPQGS
ncbi:PepSY domain-containing protein [Parvularcula flava]|uniref:PepSY domain-containing protein n=1 Tax=Aquisalinus luteolus TaxID=1566827 RepID=A0A8J3A425_9PROT|nr:PepSY-associated TM helix domain-containing protein [Aquisalinus luteolus]NHK28994.1 PepSY domain-containing protein [Aquisalinus luteolus]GGI00636.1 hypothetical protein GCM10011355_29400 [Aquisalinus luteolus]